MIDPDQSAKEEGKKAIEEITIACQKIIGNKPYVIVIGHRENIFHWLPQVEFFNSFDDMMCSDGVFA